MIDAADAIRQAVTVPEVLDRYGLIGTGRRSKNRCPCPIHGGTNPNFAYTDTVYHCFVCGAHGDVISLTMALFNINFKQALMRLNTDFRLGLPLSGRVDKRAMAELAERRRIEATVRRIKQARADFSYEHYLDISFELIRAENAVKSLAGLNIKNADDIPDEICKAIHALPYLRHQIDNMDY